MTAKAQMSVLVYDVGGSHVSAAVCHSNTYRLGPVLSAPLPEIETSDAFVGMLHSLGVRASAGLEPVAGAELAFPGPFNFEAGISQMQHKLSYLYGIDLRKEIADRFAWEPIQVQFLHDSAAFLLGEIGAGAARGVRREGNVRLQGPDDPIGIASRKRHAEIAGKASLPITIHADIRTAR